MHVLESPVINTLAARFMQAGAARMMAVPPDFRRPFQT